MTEGQGPEVVDVEVQIGTGAEGDKIAIFLHHPDENRRIEAESFAWRCGAEFVSYPSDLMPPVGMGQVEIRNATLYISIGRMYIISPFTMKAEEVASVERAVVFFTDGPFDPADQTEKTWLAVHLPLVRPSEETA